MSNTPESDKEYARIIADHSIAVSNEIDRMADFARTLETKRDEARAEVERLRKALQALFDSYKQLADCGDAGNWSLEEQPEGKQAMEALGIPVLGNPVTPTVATHDTSPEIFEAHRLEWYRHTPGDAMPCDGKTFVQNLLQREKNGGWFNANVREACEVGWGIWDAPEFNTVGWRPADAPEKLERK